MSDGSMRPEPEDKWRFSFMLKSKKWSLCLVIWTKGTYKYYPVLQMKKLGLSVLSQMYTVTVHNSQDM
jgi:hypothetical protein